MNIPILNGLAEVAGDYDLFILDLWGVVHDGEAVYPGAVDCMRRLRGQGSRVVLLSNTALPLDAAAAYQLKFGVTPDLYDWLLSSGEVTANAVAAGAKGGADDARPAYYYLGPERSRPLLAACGGREVELDEAEIIICAGLVDNQSEQPGDYQDLLARALARGLTMVCANPDIAANHGERILPGAGALAALYEDLGGTVQRYGKPYPHIFDRVFLEFGDVPRHRAVMIGDGLATDIRGARQAGIDALWIGGGIHAEALAMGADGELTSEKVDAVAEHAGERPKAILPWFRW